MTRDASPLRPVRVAPVPLDDLARDTGLRPRSAVTGAATGIAARTEDLRPGDVFAALPGARTHGARFAAEAARAGAVAILTDAEGAVLAGPSGLPLLVTDEPRRALGPVAARILRPSGLGPSLLGVTGTNGKTTTVHLLAHLLGRLGVRAGLSSTAERGIGADRAPSRLTTPEADELQALLARMAEDGADAACIEVSAQALVRSRVAGLVFDVVAFTNLSHDHLDDFGTMEAYLAAKARLFEPAVARRAVVCVDSPAGASLARTVRGPVTTITTDPARAADWHVDTTADGAGTAFVLTGASGERLDGRMLAPGAHHALDACIAAVMAIEAGHDAARVARALADAPLPAPVAGRLEHVPGSHAPAVHLDVGHTPDSLAKSLEALRPLTAGPLVVLFGADGDRDTTKREPMGRVAGALADVVIVHDHHSRFEDPDDIRRAVLLGARAGDATVHDVPDPRAAIRRAIEIAGADGSVLWAGTGRTDYRDIDGTKRPFSFWETALEAIREHEGAAERL